MARYLSVRLLHGLLVLFLISVVTFAIMRFLPGDPVYLLLGEGEIRISQEQMDAIRHKWGLDKPHHEQYLIWVSNMVRLDFGTSLIRRGVPVRDMIFEAIPVTLRLNIYALTISLGLAIPAGILAAVKRNSLFDYAATVGSTVGVALPNFWIGLMSIVVFALLLGWVPPFGLRSTKGYVLPVFVLVTAQTAQLTRVMRSGTIEVLEEDYVRTARAKGLAERAVILNHAVRNALLPVVTVIGMRIAFILSGTIVVETVFAIPGIGRLFTDSVFRLDYQVVQSIVFVLSFLVVAANLLTDLVYAFVDPRIRIE
jgi:peptide/nickel transport system permease protein